MGARTAVFDMAYILRRTMLTGDLWSRPRRSRAALVSGRHADPMIGAIANDRPPNTIAITPKCDCGIPTGAPMANDTNPHDEGRRHELKPAGQRAVGDRAIISLIERVRIAVAVVEGPRSVPQSSTPGTRCSGRSRAPPGAAGRGARRSSTSQHRPCRVDLARPSSAERRATSDRCESQVRIAGRLQVRPS